MEEAALLTKKEALLYVKDFAEEIAAQRAYKAKMAKAKADWMAEIAEAELRAMEKVNFDFDFTLCKECVVEHAPPIQYEPQVHNVVDVVDESLDGMYDTSKY